MEKAKVALIQFQLSPPKTDMENQVVINDYSQMDRVLKEERAYTLNLVKERIFTIQAKLMAIKWKI